jgi:hypothetical protein
MVGVAMITGVAVTSKTGPLDTGPTPTAVATAVGIGVASSSPSAGGIRVTMPGAALIGTRIAGVAVADIGRSQASINTKSTSKVIRGCLFMGLSFDALASPAFIRA